MLAVPSDMACPSIRQPPGSGSTWYRFHARNGVAKHEDHDPRACRDLDLADPEGLRTLRGFIFASGSPFPIFPAHRVLNPQRERLEPLVDGGYSNNTPVEAAGIVGAEQVLIVNSSHPLDCEEPTQGWLDGVQGPLVEGALRLPAFLFERAQQLDRRSRANLFVVLLSPTCRPGWPFLSDFTPETIQGVLQTADDDLGRRIGMVEAWGVPRFQVSLPLAGRSGIDGAASPAGDG